MSLRGGGDKPTSDATTTVPGLVTVAVPPSGVHPIAMGRFSGAYYQDDTGSLTAGASYAAAWISAMRIYDTDNYLQAGLIKAPFDGYYRVTGFFYSWDQIVGAYTVLVQRVPALSGSDFWFNSGQGDAINGMEGSVSKIFSLTAGQEIAMSATQSTGSPIQAGAGIQVDYLGPI